MIEMGPRDRESVAYADWAHGGRCMSPDILLAAGLALVQVATAYWGLYVTFHPPTTSHEKTRHTIAFWALGIVGVGLVVWSGYRSETAQDAVQNELSQIHSGVDKLLLGSSRPAPAARILTDSDKERLVAALTPFANTSAKVTVGCLAADGPGPCNYGQQWKKGFEDAHWRVTDRLLPQLYMPPFAGVHIAVSSEATPGAGLIQHAFKSVGVDATGEIDSSIPADEIQIKVGADV